MDRVLFFNEVFGRILVSILNMGVFLTTGKIYIAFQNEFELPSLEQASFYPSIHLDFIRADQRTQTIDVSTHHQQIDIGEAVI